jgi:hypothetical protein
LVGKLIMKVDVREKSVFHLGVSARLDGFLSNLSNAAIGQNAKGSGSVCTQIGHTVASGAV